MTQSSILSAVDWHLVAFAAAMGAVASLLMTWRARNAQQARNLPLTPWGTVIPDTLLGSFTGTFGSLLISSLYRPLRTFEGIALLAALCAVLGPQVWDWISRNGRDTLLDWAASVATGGLQKLAEAAAKRKGGPPDDPQHPADPS